ncbi:retrotransposon protein [Cucumis melo var. makuwa]|uniref:Retrotransposon protein n=1 Tax=Cucumis melo var. makuwa TaxID=1194695 RepID=A0A5D3CEI4_CUCMM|nr:retrotransposon protein [Cucumis melo var. makuwa]TYK08769.1 retrotransposon protein [Cucumis melo var. makuwa]
MKVIDVEEMVVIFLHVLAQNVKNHQIQREFIRSKWPVSLGTLSEGRGDMPSRFGERRGLKVGQRDLPIKLSIVVDTSYSKRTLNKPFSHYDKLLYVFEKDHATGAHVEMFTDIRSNMEGPNNSVQVEDGLDTKFLTMCTPKMNMSPDDMMAN